MNPQNPQYQRGPVMQNPNMGLGGNMQQGTAPTMSPNPETPAQSPTASFQQMMRRLEEIANLLNNPQIELEQAMALFKEGLQLSAACQKKLDEFEGQMNQLITQEQS